MQVNRKGLPAPTSSRVELKSSTARDQAQSGPHGYWGETLAAGHPRYTVLPGLKDPGHGDVHAAFRENIPEKTRAPKPSQRLSQELLECLNQAREVLEPDRKPQAEFVNAIGCALDETAHTETASVTAPLSQQWKRLMDHARHNLEATLSTSGQDTAGPEEVWDGACQAVSNALGYSYNFLRRNLGTSIGGTLHLWRQLTHAEPSGPVARICQPRPSTLPAKFNGREGPSPNQTGRIESAAQLAQVVYAGYNGGRLGPISVVPALLACAREPNKSEQVYVVTLSGTEFVPNQGTGIIGDLRSGFELNHRLLASTLQVIQQTVPRNAKLILAGHSLGGMAAQQLAALPKLKREYDIANTVTFGAPLILGLFGGGREGEIRRLADRIDPVPGFSPAALIASPWNHFGAARRGGGVKETRKLFESPTEALVDAHLHSYTDVQKWKGFDALGRHGGDATLTFDPRRRKFFTAPAL